MHHPACWVKNNGCATNTEHQSVPIAVAYAPERFTGGEAPHPGEGTRVMPLGGRAPIELRQRQPVEGPVAGVADDGPVIGADAHPPVRTIPPLAALADGVTKRKAAATSGAYKVDRAGKALPNLYVRHRILQFWYVPAAVGLAVVIAFGVIWIAGSFGGDADSPALGDGTTPSARSTPSTAATNPGGSATQPPTSGTPTAPAASVTGGKFQVNDPVVVTGVGAGTGSEAGCLNVRTEPGTGNPAIVCVPDGTQLTVVGGPQETGGLKWWKVRLTSGDGWAAEDYLVKR